MGHSAVVLRLTVLVCTEYIRRMFDIRLSSEQERAVAAASRWMSASRGPQVFRLFGSAGTGKTTLLRRLVEESGAPWLYAAFTGKAALVMHQKGCRGARTIHSLIYRPDEEGKKKPRAKKSSASVDGEAAASGFSSEISFRLWKESPLASAPGVVVDEGSMIDEDLARDLMRFKKKILVCADPAQLPPVDGSGFFMQAAPDVMLTEVHRQARDSGIIDLATHVRQGGSLDSWASRSFPDCRVLSRSQLSSQDIWELVVGADQVVVGMNRTRHEYNAMYRRLLQIDNTLPVPGDKVICLRNDRERGLLNGSMWGVASSVSSGDGQQITLELHDPDRMSASPGEVVSWSAPFLGMPVPREARRAFQEFDYGYCITCHKAQGSQWDKVVLFDESSAFRDDRQRWLYTGITRAARDLTVLSS
jgi:exodeoxyribonuclease V